MQQCRMAIQSYCACGDFLCRGRLVEGGFRQEVTRVCRDCKGVDFFPIEVCVPTVTSSALAACKNTTSLASDVDEKKLRESGRMSSAQRFPRGSMYYANMSDELSRYKVFFHPSSPSTFIHFPSLFSSFVCVCAREKNLDEKGGGGDAGETQRACVRACKQL